jgi:hypoxanthine phosphoribosyltransferase
MAFYDASKIETLYDQATLNARNRELGAQITADYKGQGDLVLVGVLRGSFPFIADLCRYIDLPVEVDFLGLSSYGDRTETSGIVRMTQDLSEPIKGKHVLVVSPTVGTALVKSAANIPHLSVLRADSLNVVDLVNADTIIVEQSALAEIQEVYG